MGLLKSWIKLMNTAKNLNILLFQYWTHGCQISWKKGKKEENKAKRWFSLWFSRLKDECFQGVLSEELWAKGSVQ